MSVALCFPEGSRDILEHKVFKQPLLFGFFFIWCFFFGTSAKKVNKHVHISMSGESEPTCCCLTAEQMLPSRQL